MSNELARIPQHSEMMEMAKLFVESKMFDGIDKIAAAFVKIKAGSEIGIQPFAAMSGIHIIKGKVSIGAGLMAGCVKGSMKYDYKVIQMDDTVCSIDFIEKNGKPLGRSVFTIQDAKRAQTQNTEKFPRNMLFARAMSNGVKWFCPDVFTMPVYTPDEISDAPAATEDISYTDANGIQQPPATEGQNIATAPPPTEPVKPMLAEKPFLDAVNRIKNGEVNLVAMCKETFSLTEEQIKALDEAAIPATETKPAEPAPAS